MTPFILFPLRQLRNTHREQRSRLLDNTSSHLIQLNTIEQRLEIAFAKAFVAFALDNLEENRPDHILSEYLQQKPLPLGRGAVNQDAAGAQRIHIFAVAGKAFINQIKITLDGFLENNATGPYDEWLTHRVS